MTNLPKSFRESMVKEVEISRLRQIEVNISKTREAVKFVFEVKNGRRIESILISDGSRRTVCLSSQIGCRWIVNFVRPGVWGYWAISVRVKL